MRTYPWQFDHRLYPDAYLLAQVSEAQVQQAILDLLIAEHIPALAVDAGAAKMRGRMASIARKLGADHPENLVHGLGGASYAGLPDILGTLPGGRALYIEVKAPAWYRIGRGNHMRIVRNAGEPSDDQLAYLDRMTEAGALGMVAWSAGDVEDVLRNAMKEEQ